MMVTRDSATVTGSLVSVHCALLLAALRSEWVHFLGQTFEYRDADFQNQLVVPPASKDE